GRVPLSCCTHPFRNVAVVKMCLANEVGCVVRRVPLLELFDEQRSPKNVLGVSSKHLSCVHEIRLRRQGIEPTNREWLTVNRLIRTSVPSKVRLEVTM